MGVEEGLGDDDGSGAAVGGGTALEFCEWGEYGRRGEDLVEGVDVTELGVWVFGGMEVVYACYFCKVFRCGSISASSISSVSIRDYTGWRYVQLDASQTRPFHILPPRITKHLHCPRRVIRNAPRLLHHLTGRARRIGSIPKGALQPPGRHLLESHNHNHIRHTMAHHIPRHLQARRASGAIIVDIVDGDLSHAKLIEDALAAC